MIQRIQTVYFALTAIVLLVAMFFPIALFGDAKREVWFYLHQIVVKENGAIHSTPINVLIPLCVVIMITSIVSIFLYKQRKLQMRMAIYNVIMLVFLNIFYLWNIIMLAQKNNLEYFIKIGALLPLISLILCFLAWWNVRKDEKLVNSIDRLR